MMAHPFPFLLAMLVGNLSTMIPINQASCSLEIEEELDETCVACLCSPIHFNQFTEVKVAAGNEEKTRMMTVPLYSNKIKFVLS